MESDGSSPLSQKHFFQPVRCSSHVQGAEEIFAPKGEGINRTVEKRAYLR
jgi:hypothetical protein